MKAKFQVLEPVKGNPTPRILALTMLGMLLLLAMTGCQADKSGVSNTEIAGVYKLVSVNGNIVPCALTHEGVAMTVKSGELAINADGTCRCLSVFTVPPQRDIHREVQATFTQSGVELTMHWRGAGTTKGKINGNEFTMNNEGMIFYYRK